jgi:hypothetical protein
VPVISGPQEFNVDQLYVDLQPIFSRSLFLKCEGLNMAGSIKLKAATEMVTAAERAGTLRPGSILVESSSGNLGVALSMLAANKGYGFVCVTDSRCNLSARLTMEALGAQVHVITDPDPDRGLGCLVPRRPSRDRTTTRDVFSDGHIAGTPAAGRQASRVREPWRPGDVMLVDNIRTAHSREPFTGRREILVAMTDPITTKQLNVTNLV